MAAKTLNLVQEGNDNLRIDINKVCKFVVKRIAFSISELVSDI